MLILLNSDCVEHHRGKQKERERPKQRYIEKQKESAILRGIGGGHFR